MSRAFIPAAGHDLFLPLYDPLWRLMGGERVRAAFIRDAGLAAPQRILDIGCGTGSLPVQIAATVPGTEVTGLDPDPKALRRGSEKATAAGVDVSWREGFGDDLPFDDGAFDRVVSSFMFHHLDPEVKRGMLREARRVLRPGGELHLIDFGGQASGKDGVLARLLHRHDHVAGNLDAELFTGAGFADVAEVSRSRSLFGRYAHVRGISP
jgi:ubiquinone/menaquinone biosynthesis C-methylase UbiE